MEEYKINDYWCLGCGLVFNSDFVCPICGSIEYTNIKLDLSTLPNKSYIMELYDNGSLYVHRENGKLTLRNKSIGRVVR